MNKPEQIMFTWNSGKVSRFHVVPTVKGQSTAEHQWGVAILATKLFPDDIDQELMLACLQHDVPERVAGDTPYPTKRQMRASFGDPLEEFEREIGDMAGIVTTLPPGRKADILAFCDMLECALQARYEVTCGNMHLNCVLQNALSVLRRMSIYAEVDDVVRMMFQEPQPEDSDWWKEMMS